MFKQIRKQKGLEILEYGLIAALVIGGAAGVYSLIGAETNKNTYKAVDCLKAPGGENCAPAAKSP